MVEKHRCSRRCGGVDTALSCKHASQRLSTVGALHLGNTMTTLGFLPGDPRLTGVQRLDYERSIVSPHAT